MRSLPKLFPFLFCFITNMAKYRVLVNLDAYSLPNQMLFHFLFLLIPAARREGDVVYPSIIDY
jgi:hypothetical protein